MSQTATAKAKLRNGIEQFPIHYERDYLRVYTNPSDELFVEDTRLGVLMRFDSSRPGALRFTTDARVESIRVTHIIGWCVELL